MRSLLLSGLFLSQVVLAQSYIVMFQQSELSIASLEHGAYTDILQSTNKKSVGQLKDWLGARGYAAKPVGDLWLIRGAYVELETEAAKKLSKEAWVRAVSVDKVRQLVNPSPDLIVGNSLSEVGGEDLWGLKRIGLHKIKAEFPSITGAGVRVGVIDTGIQSKHPELGNKTVVFKDFVNNLQAPYDDQGHGTHVSGTISGNKVGIAPNVSITFAKAFTAVGAASDSILLSAMQWIFDPDGNSATNDYPQIVSNSWGGDLEGDAVYNLAQFEPYRAALQTWIHGGVIPVFAAGNSGKRPNGIPGGLPDALAVGAIQPTDEIADFSSRGPNIWKVGESVLTLLKPDISAPGVKIPSAFPGNKYATWAGTSMATPHVAGAIALALQVNPKLKFADIKELLLKTSEKKMDTSFGYGILNAYEFVKAAKLKR